MLLKIGAGELGGMKSGSEKGGMDGLSPRQMSVLLVRLEESDRLDTIKLGAAVEEGDLKNEEITDQITAQLLDERASSSSGAASSNNVVDHKHFLAGFHRTLLHLEKVGSVLLFVGGCHARTGHLALLADRHKTGIETQSERGPKKEAPRIQPHHNIRLRVGELEDLEFEGAQQRKMDDRVLEQGENVDKVDAGDREVREPLEGAEESYLCTGEFGGTGGGGGGLSSRGIVGIGGGAASQDGGFDRGRGDLVFAGLRQRLGSVGGSAHVEGREGGKEGKGKGRQARQAGAVLVSQEQEKNCGQQGVQHEMLGRQQWKETNERIGHPAINLPECKKRN
jgi:hypothetical protein